MICWMHLADRGRRKDSREGRRRCRSAAYSRPARRTGPDPVTLARTLLSIRREPLARRGMDAIDGTPVVDIKSHSPELDSYSSFWNGEGKN